MKIPIGATKRGLLRRMRDILRVGRDLALVAFDAPVLLVAAADTPVPFAPALEEAHLPTTAKLVTAIRQALAF